MKAIYKFRLRDYGRDTIEGKFVERTEIIQELEKRNPRVFIDEPWGKHSYVDEPFSEFCVELVSDDPNDVEMFIKLDLWSGENPIDNIADSSIINEVEAFVNSNK